MLENNINEAIHLDKNTIEEVVEYSDHDYLGHNFYNKDRDEVELLACNICGMDIPESKVLEHMEDEHYKFQCSQCGKKYYKESQLRQHLGRSHLEKLKLKCPFCPAVLSRKYNYKQHILTHSSKVRFKCSFKNCGKSYKQLRVLKRHKKVHQKQHRSERCDSPDDITRLQTPEPTDSDEFVCHEFDSVFLIENSLNDCTTKHETDSNTCHLCKRTYQDSRCLYRHKRSVHSGKRHVCPECGQSYSRRDNMLCHVRRYHRDAYLAKKAKLNAGRSDDD